MDIPGPSLEILRPNNFTLPTTSEASPLMRMGSNSCWDFEKDIRISLHLSVFSWTLFSGDHRTTCCDRSSRQITKDYNGFNLSRWLYPPTRLVIPLSYSQAFQCPSEGESGS